MVTASKPTRASVLEVGDLVGYRSKRKPKDPVLPYEVIQLTSTGRTAKISGAPMGSRVCFWASVAELKPAPRPYTTQQQREEIEEGDEVWVKNVKHSVELIDGQGNEASRMMVTSFEVGGAPFWIDAQYVHTTKPPTPL